MPESPLPVDVIDDSQNAAKAAEAKPVGVVGAGGEIRPTGRRWGRKDIVPVPDISTGIQRRDVNTSGATTELSLTNSSRGQMAELLRERIGVSQKLAEDKKDLNQLDKLLLSRGDEIAIRLEGGGELSTADLAVAWTLAQNDLMQFSSAARMVYEENPGKHPGLKNFPILRRWSIDSTSGFVPGETTNLTSEYVKAHGIAELPQEKIMERLDQLNTLRRELEAKLNFRTRTPDGALPGFDRINHDKLHDAVVESQRKILAQKGKTMVELRSEDAQEAQRVMEEALLQGMTRYAGELGLQILLDDKPNVDADELRRKINKLDEPADPEEVEKKTEEKDEAKRKRDDAKSEYDNLQRELKDAKEKVKAATRSLDQAQRAHDARNEKVDDGTGTGVKVNRLEKRINDLQDLIDTAKEVIKTATDSKNSYSNPDADKVAAYHAKQDVIVAQQTETMNRLIEQQSKIQDQFDTLQTRLIEAQEEDKYWKDEVRRLEGFDDTASGGTKDDGEIAEAKIKYDKEDSTFKTTEQELKDLIEPSEDKADIKKSLEIWESIIKTKDGVSGYEKVLSNWFSQKGSEAEYTQKKFADITEVDGTYAGADLLRKAIFEVIDASNGDEKNKELTRQMMSDEAAIGRGIVFVFGLDTTDFSLKELLPRLEHASNMQIAQVLQFMMKEGLKSARAGDPVLLIPEAYLKPKREMDTEARGILEEDMGVAKVESEEGKRAEVSWVGTVQEVRAMIYGEIGPRKISGKFNFRVEEDFRGGRVDAVIKVATNQDFLKNLPPTVSADMPKDVRETFYTKDGSLMTDKIKAKKSIPEWITVSDPALNGGRGINGRFEASTTEEMLNMMGGVFSADLPRSLTVEVANRVMGMSPEERQNVIRGLPDLIIEGATLGAPNDFTVRFDNNGNFMIRNEGTGDEQELGAFYERQLAAYKGGRQALDTGAREAWQGTFARIESRIGMRIMERLQLKK